MNSLQQLNGYSQSGVDFVDTRPTQFIFSANTPTNQSVTVYSNHSYTQPLGIDLTYMLSIPEDLVYTISIPTTANANVYWTSGNLLGSLTANVTYNGLYKNYNIYGITNLTEWNQVKQPTITPNTVDNFTYLTTLTYNGGATKSWNTGVTIQSLNELSTVNDYYYYTNTFGNITGTPTVIPLTPSQYHTDNYTLAITVSNVAAVGNITTSGIGTSTYNDYLKSVQVSGNVAKIQSHLGNIRYWPTPETNSDNTITYALSNPVTGYVSYRTQNAHNATNGILSTPGGVGYYAIGTNIAGNVAEYITSINNEPQITDYRLDTTYYHFYPPYSPWFTQANGAPGVGWNPDSWNASYLLEVQPLTGNVANVRVNPNENWAQEYTQISNTHFTCWGRRLNINHILQNIQVQGNVNYTGSITMVYTVTAPAANINIWDDSNSGFLGAQYTPTPTSNTVSRTQTLYPFVYDTSTDIASNISIARPFLKNTPGLLFTSNVPQVGTNIYSNIEVDTTYTIFLSTQAGEFGMGEDNTTSTYSYSGKINDVNSIFNTLNFYPYRDVTGSQTFRYKQYNDNILTANVTVALSGSGSGNILLDPQTVYLTSPGYWKPTFSQRNYYKVNVAAIGSGGNGFAASKNGGGSGYGGGGGGGGNVVTVANVTLSSLTSTPANIYVITGDVNNSQGGTTIFGNITAAPGYSATNLYGANSGYIGHNGSIYGGNGFGGGGGGAGGSGAYKNGGPGLSFTWPGFGTSPKYGAGGGGSGVVLGQDYQGSGLGGADGGGNGGTPDYYYHRPQNGSNFGSGGGGMIAGDPAGLGFYGAVILYFHI